MIGDALDHQVLFALLCTMQGAAKTMFADYQVQTDHDWTPIAAQHKDIKHEATNPAGKLVTLLLFKLRFNAYCRLQCLHKPAVLVAGNGA